MPITRSTSAVPLWESNKVVFVDTFTDADNTDVTSHTPDYIATGDSWSVEYDSPAGSPTGPTIYSNALSAKDETPSNNAWGWPYIDIGTTSYIVKTTLLAGNVTANVERTFLVVRFVSVSPQFNCWFLGLVPDGTQRIALSEQDNGVGTNRGTINVTADGVTFELEVTVTEQDITANVLSPLGGNTSITYASTLHNTSTKVGFRWWNDHDYASQAEAYTAAHANYIIAERP